MNDMENKYEELRQQIADKKDQIDTLKMDIRELEADMERYLPERFADVLERANAFLNKYFLYYNDYCNEFRFCYCKNIRKTHTNIIIEYKRIEIGQSNNIKLYETSTIMISSMEYFDSLIILKEEQAKEICDKINKIVCEEESVKDLFGYLKDLYSAETIK